MTINYNQNIDYGYEVNYLIYNYMVFFKIPINKTFGYVPPR
jgi:Gpi18-like mannosyltransferase